MAEIQRVESSAFTQSVINTYTQNKLGQYAKYLDSTRYDVTYYAINLVHSRADIGTDMVYDELGPKSPIRFNKIHGLPVYMKADFKPNISFEEGSMDVELDLSDVTLLPNTIMPKPGEFFCIEIPNSPKLLFKVTNFRMDTVQSNGFYQLDATLRRAGDKCCDDPDKMVVEEYDCVFENIGTQNNCFILKSDQSKMADLKGKINTLKDFYRDVYYDKGAGNYIFNDLKQTAVRWIQPSPETNYIVEKDVGYGFATSYYQQMRFAERRERKPDSTTFYDVFLTKFLIDSHIYFEDNSSYTASNLSYDDFLPENFDYLFRQSLWYTVLTKDTTFLSRYPHCFTHEITKVTSPIRCLRFDNPTGFTLIMHSDHKCEQIEPYLSQTLVQMILDYEENKDKDNRKDTFKVPNLLDADIINLTPLPQNGREMRSNPISPGQYEIQIPEESDEDKYDFPEFKNTINLIYNFVTGDAKEFELKYVIRELVRPSLLSYWFTPIVIYIMQQMYQGYFKPIY